ncbi:hypothetical protein [Lonepinella sp. MS14436]|uniref:hypothetical protein n=1 Tax=unclassified Lonepinella TaxID=2642006 RepID=UPI0036DCAED7
MKRFIVYLFFSLPVFAQATDWTPLFEYRTASQKAEDNATQYNNEIKVIESLIKSAQMSVDMGWETEGVKVNTCVATPEAVNGQYSNVPLPYRKNLLPAKTLKDGLGGSEIPLKNASLFGLKIKSIQLICGFENWNEDIVFAPMSEREFQLLKQGFNKVAGSGIGCGAGSWYTVVTGNSKRAVLEYDCGF